MPPRSCLGCGRLIAAGSRCRACRLRKGSTRSWRKLRQQVRVRGGHRCYRCGGRATEVDHVIPLAMGGRDHPDNLKACCRRCNRVKGAA